jgi:hypothetical protein
MWTNIPVSTFGGRDTVTSGKVKKFSSGEPVNNLLLFLTTN